MELLVFASCWSVIITLGSVEAVMCTVASYGQVCDESIDGVGEKVQPCCLGG